MVTLTTGISFVILVKTALSYEMRWVILESVHGFLVQSNRLVHTRIPSALRVHLP